MAVYADYEFYTTEFLGTAIAEADFPALALRASAVIDQITFGRAASASDSADATAIANATCAVAEELQRQAKSGDADGIVSESQGRYSVSYAAHSSKTKSNLAKLQNAATPWLANTYLTFAGFGTGEYSGDR